MECINARQNGVLDEATSSHVGPNCNDCNEVTPRLARVAKNALLNGDFPRVIGILDRLSSLGLSDRNAREALTRAAPPTACQAAPSRDTGDT